jgi:predicted NAD/FAD-dependent oxidoreductase
MAVLLAAERDYLAAVRYRPGVAVAYQIREPAMAPARRIVVAAGGALAALQFQAAAPRKSDVVVAIGTQVFAASSVAESDALIARRLSAEAERVAPRQLRDVRELRVLRWPEALPCFEVGHYRAIASLRKVEASEQAAGRCLAFAGDHLVGPRIDDAVASGLRAADALSG